MTGVISITLILSGLAGLLLAARGKRKPAANAKHRKLTKHWKLIVMFCSGVITGGGSLSGSGYIRSIQALRPPTARPLVRQLWPSSITSRKRLWGGCVKIQELTELVWKRGGLRINQKKDAPR
jgi:hypothetical protein